MISLSFIFFSLRIPLVEEFILFSPARRKYLASASNYSIYLLCLGGRGVSFGLITLLTDSSFILRPLARETKPSLLSYIIFPSSFITYCTHGSFCFSLILWIFFCLLIMVPCLQVRAGVLDCLSFLRSTHDAPEWNHHVWKIN